MKTKLTWMVVGIAALGLHAGMAAAAGKPPQVPQQCLEPHLPQEVQRLCDQLRFADVPHYHVVRHASNGAVRSIHLIETETGRAVATSYPHGIKFAAPVHDDSELRLRPEELTGALDGRPPPESAPPPSRPAGAALGLPIGWNSSTGPTSGDCFNYAISTPSTNVGQSSFSALNTATSSAGQIRATASVNFAFDLYTADANFAFSDQWQSSTNSANRYFNFYSLYTLNTTLYPNQFLLSPQGQSHTTDGTFNVLCGNEYMAAVPVGMIATININYGASSSSTEEKISTQFEGEFDLVSVKLAVEAGFEDTSSSSHFSINFVHYGGGPDVSQIFQDAFSQVNENNVAFYALCAKGEGDACDTFTGNMGTAAAKALALFNQKVADLDLSGATNPNLSFLQTFPHGVAGALVPVAVPSPLPAIPNNFDLLFPYASQLKDYVRLLNDISTLNNRVVLLLDLLGLTPSLNTSQFLDLVSYLNRLENTYSSDRTILLGNLTQCLTTATAGNVQILCGAIINNTAKDAYTHYGGTASSQRNFFAQQNALALQYTGSIQQFTQAQPTVELDVIYIDKLPTFAAAGPDVPIAGEAAFVSFKDRPTAGSEAMDPSVTIMALQPNEPLSTDSVSAKVRQTSASSPFVLYVLELNHGFTPPFLAVVPSAAQFTSSSCMPTFTNPCAINYVNENGVSFVHDQIENMFPIE